MLRPRDRLTGPVGRNVDPTRAIWRRMADELGLQGLAIPEDLGGQGFGLSEMTIVFEELGRALFAAPMLGSVGLAARTLLHAPASTVRDDALRGIASGALVAASTAAAPGGVTATAGGPAAGLLSGATGAVVDADHADLLVVVAATSDGSALYVVSAGAPGVLRETQPGIDLTRGSARVTFTDVHAELVAGPDAIGAALGRGLAEGTVLLASESVGGARAALEEAVAYSKVRSQFGRQIGSFQALKHRMADILIVDRGCLVDRPARRGPRGPRACCVDRRAPARGQCGEGSLVVRPDVRDRRGHPDPRRHRVHLGTPGTPAIPPGQGKRGVAGPAPGPPRTNGLTARQQPRRGPVDGSEPAWTSVSTSISTVTGGCPRAAARSSVLETASEQVIGSVPSANATDVDNAVGAATRAFDSWSVAPVAERARVLRALADGLEAQAGSLAELMSREVGTPIATSQRRAGRSVARRVPLDGRPHRERTPRGAGGLGADPQGRRRRRRRDHSVELPALSDRGQARPGDRGRLHHSSSSRAASPHSPPSG